MNAVTEDRTEAHIAASKYANERVEAMKRFRKENSHPHGRARVTWVAHYEGYRDALEQRSGLEY